MILLLSPLYYEYLVDGLQSHFYKSIDLSRSVIRANVSFTTDPKLPSTPSQRPCAGSKSVSTPICNINPPTHCLHVDLLDSRSKRVFSAGLIAEIVPYGLFEPDRSIRWLSICLPKKPFEYFSCLKVYIRVGYPRLLSYCQSLCRRTRVTLSEYCCQSTWTLKK